MKAGRELDALVAEKVMGLGPPTHEADWMYGTSPGEGYGDYAGWWCTRCDGYEMPAAIRLSDPLPETHHHYELRAYSTSIADAWLVVEKMKADGWWFQLTDVMGSSQWVAEYSHDDGWAEYADTAPEAICLAALRALGHDV